MASSVEPKPSQQKTYPLFRIKPWDVFTGLPAGALIFMSTVLFNTLFNVNSSLPVFVPIVILALMSLMVGLLAGITRLRQGPATGLSAGIIAAAILAYLWLAARPGDVFNPLVIGPAGMIVTLFISPLGGWLGARLRKAL